MVVPLAAANNEHDANERANQHKPRHNSMRVDEEGRTSWHLLAIKTNATHVLYLVVVVVVVVVVVLTLTRIIKSVVTGQAPVTLEWRNTSGKKHKQKQKWYTHIS